jgi:hypothetical protein
MVIRDKDDAGLAIAALCSYLHQQTKDWQPSPKGFPGEEPEIAEQVRTWCQGLLTNAKAADLGGCMLCQA